VHYATSVLCTTTNLGVTQNYAEAYYWFAIAASAEIAEQKQIIKIT
jgi:TPR repeat protein